MTRSIEPGELWAQPQAAPQTVEQSREPFVGRAEIAPPPPATPPAAPAPERQAVSAEGYVATGDMVEYMIRSPRTAGGHPDMFLNTTTQPVYIGPDGTQYTSVDGKVFQSFRSLRVVRVIPAKG